MKTTVVWGPPCSGKTTYVRDNRSENSLTYDFDAIMAALSGLPEYYKNPNLREYIRAIRGQIVNMIAEDRNLSDVWVITTWVDEQLNSIEGAQQILMQTDKSTCLQRANDRPDGTAEVIESWFNKYESEGRRMMENVKKDAYTEQRRILPADEMEMRVSATEDGSLILEGYAAKFNKQSRDLGGFTEIIRAGAFTQALKTSDALCLFNHDPSMILGRQKAGTLKLDQDTIGLRYKVTLPDTTTARDVHTLVKNGLVDQCSFAFRVAGEGDNWTEQKDGLVLREITGIDFLADVGPVSYPAYPQTSVTARSILKDAGIDIDGVTAVFVRAQRGQLTEADRDVIHGAISAMRSLLPEPATQEGETGEQEKRDGEDVDTGQCERLRRLANLRRLVEIS